MPSGFLLNRAALLKLNWKRASMAAALGYYATDFGRGPCLWLRLKPGSYDTTILSFFYPGEQQVRRLAP
ncbi:hypothetical protein [Streptomyces sp. NPDC007355]|uniref:hypothetical protein n=1 Tax=Streptomyces sp. NPDC007355 TaxID=3364778 RepID=UPI0036CCAEFF